MSEAGRTPQPPGARGSLKWIQRAVAENWPDLEQPILNQLGGSRIEWLSPLQSDDFAEYRDAAFLRRLGIEECAEDLARWWPRFGPQWDALGRTDRDQLILVEAKAHIAELCSPGSGAGPASRARITSALECVAEKLGASDRRAPWADCFYQLANRLAYLSFLRDRGHSAFLVLVGFIGDSEMKGPASTETWDAAYEVAFHSLGLPKRHVLTPYIVHTHPDVRR
jgi:hypothetical protein